MTTVLKGELDFLFNTLCNGLLQEVHRRYCAGLQSVGQDFSLTTERGEQGVIPLLGAYLQNAGFIVKYESYYLNAPQNLRPDLRIWLPISQKFIFLEVKMTAWGNMDQYYWADSPDDMKKLGALSGDDLLNGFLCFGFSKSIETSRQLEKGFNNLSEKILNQHSSYEKIGLKTIDLLSMDVHTSYAVIGLWFRKQEGDKKMDEIINKLDEVIKQTTAIEASNSAIDLPANRYIASQIGMALSNLRGARLQLISLNDIYKKSMGITDS